jgi:hypothetical protein
MELLFLLNLQKDVMKILILIANDHPQDEHSMKNNSRQKLDPEKFAHLIAEAKAPYKGLRMFFYFAFAASGLIGALVFFTQLIAGRDVASALPNFALQLGLVALMIWLLRWEQRK